MNHTPPPWRMGNWRRSPWRMGKGRTRGNPSSRRSSPTQKEETFAQKIAPLAEKITEYINDHQDDAAQEDRWRTTMKRETMKRFREQREATDTQGEAIAEVRRAIDQQREATAEVHRLIVKIGNSLSLASGAVGVTNQVGAEMENLEC